MISFCVEQIEILFNIHWKYENDILSIVSESDLLVNQLIQNSKWIRLTDGSDPILKFSSLTQWFVHVGYGKYYQWIQQTFLSVPHFLYIIIL